MRNLKVVFIAVFLICFEANDLLAQTTDCADIKVEAKTTNPTASRTDDGSIDLVFDKPVSNYKIIWLNAGNSKTDKEEINGGRLTNLKAGFYDFLILDKNKKGCTKQLTVILK